MVCSGLAWSWECSSGLGGQGISRKSLRNNNQLTNKQSTKYRAIHISIIDWEVRENLDLGKTFFFYSSETIFVIQSLTISFQSNIKQGFQEGKSNKGQQHSTDIATYILDQPWGQLSEKLGIRIKTHFFCISSNIKFMCFV